jgi:hypothetical protein
MLYTSLFPCLTCDYICYYSGCTIPALNYAVLRNRACCARLVDVGGMKYIFPLLTGKKSCYTLYGSTRVVCTIMIWKLSVVFIQHAYGILAGWF